MKRTTTLTNPDLPQLRQMVLENTERINKNERMINRMRMENLEQSKRIGEYDEFLENSRREFDRQMRISNERMDRLERFSEAARIEHEKYFLDLKKQREESDRRIEENRKESDRRIEEYRKASDQRIEEHRKETDRQIKEYREETERQIKKHREETDKRIEEHRKETDRQIKMHRDETDKRIEKMFEKTNASISRISREFLGATGHIVEGLASSSVDKIFKDAGFDLLHYGKNIKPKSPEANQQMEIDVMLGNDRLIVPIEVKADCTKKKVKRYVHSMERFRAFFPEYADEEVIAAIAALNYENGADTLAHEEGLLVIRVSSDNIFSIDPFDREKLRRF